MIARGQFLDPLVHEHVKGRIYRLKERLRYQARDGRIYEAEAGFEYNGASVPRILWWLYPPFGGDYDEGVTIHDKLYADALEFPGSDHGHISRAEADAVLLEAMEAKDFRESGRNAVYRGVRLGGWWSWRQHRKRDVLAHFV